MTYKVHGQGLFNTHHFPEYLASTFDINPRVSTVTASSSLPDPIVCALSALKSMFRAIMKELLGCEHH